MEDIDLKVWNKILMPQFQSTELSWSVQKKLGGILHKTSHNFWELDPSDAIKACEIAFRIQPSMFVLSEVVIENILSGLLKGEGSIQFKETDGKTKAKGFYRSATRSAHSYEEYGSEICHSNICVHVDKCRYGILSAIECMNHELNHLLFDAQFLINNFQKPDSFDRVMQLHNSLYFDQATEISAWFWGKLSSAYCIGSCVRTCPGYLEFPLPSEGEDGISEIYSQSAKIGVLLTHAYLYIHDYLAKKYGSSSIRNPKINRYNTLLDAENALLELWLKSLYNLFFELIEKGELIPKLESFLEKNSANPEILISWIIDHSFHT